MVTIIGKGTAQQTPPFKEPDYFMNSKLEIGKEKERPLIQNFFIEWLIHHRTTKAQWVCRSLW